MKLTTYRDATPFLQDTEAILQQEEVMNGLMLGISLRLQQRPDQIKQQPYMATVMDGETVRAIALMTPPYPVILYAPDRQERAALIAIAQDLKSPDWCVSGVNAPAPLARSFVEIWQQQTDQSATLVRQSRIYELRQVIMPDSVPGHLRLATQDDFDLIQRWIGAFQVEALPGEVFTDSTTLATQGLADQRFYLWVNQEAVTLVGWTRPTQRGISVGPVYTPPSFRRQGYASAATAHLSQKLLDQGYEYCTLFTDLANPTSNSIYQKIGYQPVCDFNQFSFVGENGG